MSELPNFNLNASNINFASDEALQAKLAQGNFIDEPGVAELNVVNAEFHKNKEGSIYCKGDSSWFNVKLTFKNADGKEINHWVQVPTNSIEFGEKKTLALFRKLQEFLIGLGEVVTIAKIQGLLEKYFTNLDKLKNQKVKVELGYEGPYVTKAPDSDEFVVMVKGQILEDDEGAEGRLPDRASAVQFAKSQGIEPGFLRILKFLPKKVAKPSKAASADW